MSFIYKSFFKLRNSMRGQTMTEYALILAAVAIVVWITYQILGQDVSTMVNKVDLLMSSAS